MVQFRCNGMQRRARLKYLFWCGAGWLAGLSTQPTLAGTNTMTRVGPYGGYVSEVAFHPTNPSIVYAATGAGFYRSTDGGVSWQIVNDNIPNGPRDIAVHPSQPNRVFVVASAPGVLASDDAGATLTRLDSSTDIPIGTAIEYSADGSALYVTTNNTVYRSTDHGNSWLARGDIPSPPSGTHALIVDPADASRLYVTASDPGQGFQSADGGMTWQTWQTPGGIINSLHITSTQPARIWAAGSSGTWFTDDRGVNWTEALSSISETVTVDPNDAEVVYAGTSQGLQRSDDNGVTWSIIHGDAAIGNVTSIAIDPSSNRLLMSGRAGIAGSDDGGAHWASRHSGIDAMYLHELVSAPASGRIYINVHYDGLHALATEDGSSVALANRQLGALSGQLGADGFGLRVLPGTPDRLLIGLWNGIAQSEDAGASWSLLAGSPQLVRQIVDVSADGSELLATTGEQLYISQDGGSNWASGPTVSARELSMVRAPSNPQVVYMAGRSSSGAGNVILRSADGGGTWTTYSHPGSNGVLAMVVDPRTEQTLYTSAQGELFKSTDGGQTWSALPHGQPGFIFKALTIDPQNPDILYTSGFGRILRSVDAGASWQTLWSDEIRYPMVGALQVDPLSPHDLYVGMGSRGVRQFSVQPDLQITATVPDAPTPYGARATYSYRIHNAGPFDATNVRARIQLPADATEITATSAEAPCTVAGSVVTCTAMILRTDGSADVTITSRQPAAGDFTVVATVEGDQPDAASADNSVTSNISVREFADLSVTVAAPARVTRGEAINLTLTVRNAGPNDAAAATVTFELEAGLDAASVTPSAGTTCTSAGNVVTCQLPALAAGESVSIAIVSTPTTTAGPLAHIAVIDGNGLDLVFDNNSSSAVTTVSEAVVVGGDSGRGSSGGGGGTSVFMIAALLLLSRMRAARNLRPRTPNPFS